MVIEITSRISRRTDLYGKWVECARAGVKEYVIVDRSKKCVIDDKLHGFGLTPCGDPDVSPTRMQTRSGRDKSQMYTRACFKGNEVVECSFF